METLMFDEFLDVFGERELYEKIDLFGGSDAADYKKLMDDYEIYQKIGGYPAVVVSYAEEKDLNKCYEMVRRLIAENFVYLALRRRVENAEIAGIAPWFASDEKTKGELDFYVRSLLDYKNYGIEVKEYRCGGKDSKKTSG